MFNLLFVFILALTTHHFMNGAETKTVKRTNYHKRQHALDDLSIIPIPPRPDSFSRKKSSSVSYNTPPLDTEDNLFTQESLSAPVLNNRPQIIDQLSQRSFSESKVVPSKQKKTNPLKKFNHKKPDKITPLAPIVEKPEHGLLTATRNLQMDLITFYLSCNSFNPNKPRDQFGNTAFHIIAAKKNKLHSSTEENIDEQIKTAIAIIDVFLKDYRTDFSIVNNAGSTPRELLSSSFDILFRKIFFSRCSLNTLVNKYAGKLKTAYLCGSISAEVIQGTIEHIINKSKAIEAAQEEQQDRMLPIESRFPEYATLEFIQHMFLTELNYIANDN